MEPEKTTAIVLFTEREALILRSIIHDFMMNYSEGFDLADEEEFECMRKKLESLVEQCSGATQPAAEEHLNAR